MVRRVGIVGYGLAGRTFHAPLVQRTAGLEVASVLTSDARRRAQAVSDSPGVRVTADLDDLVAGDDRVDLLVVAAANAAHVPVARRALAARIPVVVDKPLAARSADARALVREAQDRGVPLTVFHNRRWDDDFLTLRRVLGEGRLGRVHRFESRMERWKPRLRPGSWREDPDPAQGAGLLLDLGPHLVDQALAAFGPVATVYAELDRRRPSSAVDDDVFVALTHANGVRSHLWASAVAARPGPRLRALGSAAAFACVGVDPQEQQLTAGVRPGDAEWGHRAPGPHATVGVGEASTPVPLVPGAYESFYAQLVEALDGRGPLPVDPWDAVCVAEVLQAARHAAEEGTVVALPVPPVVPDLVSEGASDDVTDDVTDGVSDTVTDDTGPAAT